MYAIAIIQTIQVWAEQLLHYLEGNTISPEGQITPDYVNGVKECLPFGGGAYPTEWRDT